MIIHVTTNDLSRGKPAKRDPLLRTKLLAPRLGRDLVRHESLLARLDESFARKLTLVTAPTGFGKTTLVGLWVAGHSETPAAWVTLDESDNDPVRFWTYVLTALHALHPGLVKPTLATLRTSQQPSFRSILVVLINELARLPQPTLLILEDYHQVASQGINDDVAFLLSHLPDLLHLVIISRTEPDLPLGVLRSRGELVEITATDLRFSHLETEAFLRQAMPGRIAPSLVDRLKERTEGWPAGLRLAALTLQSSSGAQDVERLISNFSGSHRYVFDYLLQEAFAGQPVEVQTFLLQTCFLDRLTASLCDEVTGRDDGARLLAGLERANLFITPLLSETGPAWYRYHPLFAETLRHYAHQRLGEAAIRALSEKASYWYETHRMLDQAIEAALTAGLFAQGARLIEQFIEAHGSNESHTLRRWVERLPQDQLASHPVIAFAYAQVLLYALDRFSPATHVRLEPLVRTAEDLWRAEGNQAGLGEALAFRALVDWWQIDLQASYKGARQALELLPDSAVDWRGTSLLILGFEDLSAGRISDANRRILEAQALLGAAQNDRGVLAASQLLGEVNYWQGNLDQAGVVLRQVLEAATGGEDMLDDRASAWLTLASIACDRNDLAEAEQLARQALDATTRRANLGLQARATSVLALILTAAERYGPAQELLQSFLSRVHHPLLLRQIQTIQAWIAFQAGEPDIVNRWRALSAEWEKDPIASPTDRELFLQDRLLIQENQAGKAIERLEARLDDAVSQGRVRSEIEALCLLTLANYSLQDLPAAGAALTRALGIAQPRGYRRPFLDEGLKMASLLKSSIPSLARRSLAIYATALLQSFSPETTPSVPASRDETYALIEPLSRQELRVLHLLAAGLSNPDIARELVVSTNTVKTHVKSIYRKLNVSSRREVRAVASELKLL